MLENIGKKVGELGGAAALKSHLAGLSFPIEKAQLIQFAKDKGLPQPLVGLIAKFPENRKFQNADEVVDEAKTLQ